VADIPTIEEMLPAIKRMDSGAFIDEETSCIRFKLGNERATIRANAVRVSMFIGSGQIMVGTGTGLHDALADAKCQVNTVIDKFDARGRALNAAANHVVQHIAAEAHKKEPQ